MKARFHRLAGVAMLALVGLPLNGAAAPVVSDEGAPEVRVVNNYAYRIRVVLVDSDGHHRTLGYVAPKKVEIFELAAAERDGRAVRVKVVVDEPVWSAGNSGEAVRSRSLWLEEGSAVHVWVERDLTDSIIEVRSGPGA